jgi:UDP-N-acetylmuramoyl-tripeptide--D-alanyl-D-alanine ligase
MKFPRLRVVAITGSNGKTSMKDMVVTVLASRYNVVKTQANFNNEIGLPRTLLGIQPDTDIAVVEMGMRGLGQIKAMCAIARPDVAVISNVGSTHVGELGSLDNIAKAKSEILEDLPSDGFAVLNGDLPRVRAMEKKLHTGVSWFGFTEADDVRAENVEITADGSRFICKTADGSAEFFIPQIGEHNVMNALSAIAVGRHFGVQLNNIKTALQGTVLTGSRQELLHFGSYTVINDAYNASPASMEAAFATLARLKQSAQPPCRTIAVVADMLELGDTAAEAHQSVGRMAAKAKTDILLGYGEETKATVDAAAAEGVPAFHFADRQGAAKKLTEILKPGDIVLLKGSHSMQVSGIIDLVFKK